MDKLNQFRLLTINAFRILWKSKVLMSQLLLLLLIGITVLATIVLSNSSLEASKSAILNKGNLADFTVTIPEDIRNASIPNQDNENNNSGGVNNIPGNTPADKQLQQELNSLGLQYSLSKMVNMSDILSGNTFILSQANTPNSMEPTVVNNLVLDKGSNNLPNVIYSASTAPSYIQQSNLFVAVNNHPDNPGTQYFDYKNYMALEPWNLAKLMLNSIWNLDPKSTQELVQTLIPLAKVPQNEEEYNTYYNYYQPGTTTINKNSYWYKWREQMGFGTIKYTGYGFTVSVKQNVPLLGMGAQIPFTVEAYDPSSYFAVASSNFMNAHKGEKAFIPEKTLKQALQLPFKSYQNVDSATNPSQITKVYNPETGVEEPYPDFITWVAKLPAKYKIQVNSLTYVLIGSGMTPDMMYPVLNSNQLLVNSKNSGVLYLNSAGFARATFGSSNNPQIYYSVRYPPDCTHKKAIFAQVQNFTKKHYGNNTAFYLDDPKQPDYVLYLRANFLNNLQTMVLIITLIIALIIGLLSLFFIATLLRSIIKQSKVTFGVGLANGISKLELALSFFPFALLPAVLCGTVGYLISYFLMSPMNSVYNDYWTVTIPHLEMQWWLFLVVPLIVFVILYVLNLLVVFWTLRKNTQTILNSSSEFRMNWFIIHTKPLTSKLTALGSFRMTFMMGNITRFIILTLIVFAFVSIPSIIVGTINEFQNALSYTNRNKQYKFSFDLYSPTINGGYYTGMPYDQIGISTMGLYNNYSTFNNLDGNYMSPINPKNTFGYSGPVYGSALQYPYAMNPNPTTQYDKNYYFTSLFMPSTKVATELNSNIQFFSNKVFTKLDLDVNLDIAGATINPWDVAKQIVPTSIISLADNYLQKQVQINYDFYYWLQQENYKATHNIPNVKLPNVDSIYNGTPIYYSTYLPNVTQQPFTLDGSDLTADFATAPNQSQWIFTKEVNKLTDQSEWALNQTNAIAGAPTYQAKPAAVKLFVEILTNNQNPLFQYWYKYVYAGNPNKGKSDQVVPNYGYKLSLGTVPVEPNDETYTYINGTITDVNNRACADPTSAKIMGIKENSKYVILYDQNNQDLKPLLDQTFVDKNKQPIYPLIINEVVQKKYKLNVGDVLTVNANNTFDRFNRKNVGLAPYNTVKFKIVGITNSKSEEQYYTTQTIANQVLGYQNFADAANVNWNGPNNPGRGYVPFNGVFTDQQIPSLAMNYGGIYSPSGLNTSKGTWLTNVGSGPNQVNGGEILSVFSNNWNTINNLTRINDVVNYQDNNAVQPISKIDPNATLNPLVPNNVPANSQTIGDTMRHIVNLWGTTAPIVSQIQSIDTPFINATIGPTIDNTLANIEEVIVICIIPTLIIIICLLASMIIVEARRLISLMKVLGYTDLKNTFSFMFVYIIVLFLGTLLAVPFTYGMLAIVKAIAFSAFNIIISPLAPAWIYFAAFGVVALVFVGLFAYVWTQLKKINLAQEISVR